MLSGNIYEISLQETYDLFAPYLTGAEAGYVAVVGATWPDGVSRNALEKSFEALGYGSAACTYVAIETAIEPNALFTLIEGLDPLCVVAVDSAGARMLGQAYRTGVTLNAATRLFGRPAVLFSDFASLMGAPADKQRAWALLKSVPKFAR